MKNLLKKAMRTAGLGVSILAIPLTSGICDQEAEKPAATALKNAYEGAFLIGAALNNGHFTERDAASVEIIKRHFNSITAENVMKPGPLNPERGVYNFEPADQFIAFGEDNDMFIVGHTLVWHSQTPNWFYQDEEGNRNSREAQIERMRSHIKTVAGRYAGRVHGWDVLNEALNEDGSLRPSLWRQIIGDDYIRLAFQFAEEYAPDTELYYNDYNMWRPSKRDGAVAIVKDLQEQGIRIDGVGMQGHWGIDYPDLQQIIDSIDAFAALGVKVHITELDVDVLPREGGPTADIGATQAMGEAMNPWPDGLPVEVEEALAERWGDFFQILYDRRDVIDRVTFWGVHDGQSWKNNFPVRGRTNYPLLFTRQHEPRPAFDTVIAIPQQ